MKLFYYAIIVALLTSEVAAKRKHKKLGKRSKRSKKKHSRQQGDKMLKDSISCEIAIKKPMSSNNTCTGSKVEIPNFECMVDNVVVALGQSGTDVTVGYQGELDMNDRQPVTQPFWMQGICPVNVHWHLGAEHRSEGQYDENGTGPTTPIVADSHRDLKDGVRLGLRCSHYDEHDEKFTKDYDWQHCIGMHVGETYEVHWPHSLAGACGTINQFQVPFHDGVFCHAERLNLEILEQQVGVQAQVFTIVNDEGYYFPNLMNGMIVDEGLGMGVEITKYTGSTTGTSVNNTICSGYAPITWHVDRKCHMISASTFDKMCADMKMQRDGM